MSIVAETHNTKTMFTKYSTRVNVFAVSVLLLIAIIIYGVIKYRLHLLWLWYERKSDIQTFVPAINKPMPIIDVPDEWLEFQFNCIKFKLPPDLIDTSDFHNETPDYKVYSSSERHIIIKSPSKVMGNSQLLPTVIGLSSSSLYNITKGYTLPRLKLESFELSSNMFKWSMSKEQIIRYAALTVLRAMNESQTRPYSYNEYRIDDDIELFVIYSKNRVKLDWESKHFQIRGHMTFVNNTQSNNWDWARIICNSLEVMANDF